MSWTCIPYTYLQEEEEGYLPTNCSDTLQLELVKSKNIPERCCSSGNSTEFFQSFQFGTTLKPYAATTPTALKQSRNGRRYQRNSSYAAGSHSHAKTLAPQEKAKELMGSEASCGAKWHESFAKYDHDTHLWKTPQCSLLEDFIEFSETWPRWGSMLDGASSERVMSARPIKETACGSWPTPCTRDYKGANTPGALIRKDGKSRMDQLPNAVAYGGTTTPLKGQLNPDWTEWLMNWPISWTSMEPLSADEFHAWLAASKIASTE